MKLLLFMATCGIAAVFMMGCATLIENSYEYNHTSSRIKIIELRDKRPDWFSQGQARKDWEEKNNQGGNILFFYAENKKIPFAVRVEGNTVWSYKDASEQAYIDIMKQVGNYINSKTTEKTVDDVSEVTIIDAHGSRNQVQARYSSQIELQSSATYVGLKREDSFNETWEYRIFLKKITVTKVWVVYSISKENTIKAIQENDYRLQQNLNDQMRASILRQDEEKKLVELALRYKEIIAKRDKIDFSKSNYETQEIQLREIYDDLMDINNELRAFQTFKGRDDDIGKEYAELTENVENDIGKTNPSDRHLVIVGNLQMKIRDLEREIAYMTGKIKGLENSGSVETRVELERFIAEKNALIEQLKRITDRDGNTPTDRSPGKQEYNIQSQTYILSLPQKPIEKFVPSANIFVANDMVLNIDYISFTNINGINNFGKTVNNLYAPAVSVSWNNAARYCNWLSRIHGLTPCYDESGGRITRYNNRYNGYRLPEEYEIDAMRHSGSEIVNEPEFNRIGIWSSTGFSQDSQEYTTFISFGGSLGRQSFPTGETSDAGIGFRVVRNAQ